MRGEGRNVRPVMSKRFFATLITTFILFSLNIAPANAVADGNYDCLVEGNPTGTFTVVGNVVTESSDESTVACAGSVNIPSGVVKIGVEAFFDRPITSVNIPDTVTEIGIGAFESTRLVSVTIPNSVTLLGSYVFLSTSTLTSVTIGNSVTSIGDDAFGGTSLISVTIPNSVTTIGNRAFGSVSTLTSVNIPDSVTSIGASAFQGNTALTSVVIGNSVTTIGSGAFRDNPALTSVTIGNSVESIDAYAFIGTGLTSVTIPNSVEYIGEGAFLTNPALTEVSIGSSVQYIGISAFSSTSLTSVTIPNSVNEIGSNAFEETALTSVTIGNSVTTIGAGAFYGSTALTSVTFLGIAAPTVGVDAFRNVATGAKANVPYNATGFNLVDGLWNRLIVSYGSPPPVDSGSSSPSAITPVIVEAPDAEFNLKNKKYLSKNAMKTKLRKNKSFKRNPQDLYKYSIFGTSKNNCLMRGNYVMGLKKTGACELWVTRTTAKDAKYKYWVKINYSK
jgi:hypothetical protein